MGRALYAIPKLHGFYALNTGFGREIDINVREIFRCSYEISLWEAVDDKIVGLLCFGINNSI